MKVLRVYHSGRDEAHRERDRALTRAGAEVTLVVPTQWPGPETIADEPFEVIELAVRRPGDVNRHTFTDAGALRAVIERVRPDVLDLHEEPFSSLVHQVLRIAPPQMPVVTYAAQNIDKRFPPPFARWERQALSRVSGVYPCTRQAASVVVGKGFQGPVAVLPLPPGPHMTAGSQAIAGEELRLLLVGRLVPEKGVLDAVRVVSGLLPDIDARLDIVGVGPEAASAHRLAIDLGIGHAVTLSPWVGPAELAERYRSAHVLLAPSRATRTWVEQFGRMVVEAQACGAVVVGYASGSLSEVVDDAGLLVEEGNISALTAAVRHVATDVEAWCSLRERGLRAAADCSWDTVARGMLGLYAEAMSTTPTRVVRPQRVAAARRWGEPARIAGGGRPFALPRLRTDTAATRALGRLADRVARDASPPVDDRIKVVYVDHVARLSGGELALLRLVQALPEIQAHVILGEDGPLREGLEAAGATVEVMALDSRARDVRRGAVGANLGILRASAFTALYTLRLARRIRQLKPDVVHTNSLKSGYYGSLAAHIARVPVVWHLRDRIADDYLPVRAVRLTQTMLGVLPTVVVCNSTETLRTAGAKVRSGAVIGSPVTHDPYDPSSTVWESRHGNTVGIVGRLSDWKGQDVFLEAFAEIRREIPSAQALIVGSAMFGEVEIEDRLHALAGRLGIADAVTFTGFTDRVEDEMARMDVLVHASTVPEPFGQVVVEGMAAGLPVVATDAGGPAEIITPGVNGVLVPPGNAHALAAAVIRLLDDPGLRAQLGRAGVLRARDFTPEVIGRQMLDIYEGLRR